MKRFMIFLVILSFIPVVNADERLYHRLERKLERNPIKGLEYAKKLKKKRIHQPDPYYFLAKYNFQNLDSATRLSKKYSVLNRSASDVYKMNKYLRGNNYLKEQAVTLINDVSVQLENYRDTFMHYGEFDRSERLAYQYQRITGKALPTLEEIEAEKKAMEKVRKAALKLPAMVDGKYYGLPKGDENIESYNLKAEREVVRILNAAREAQGLGPLLWDENLARSARYHANDMATQNYFSHNTYDSINGELVQIGGAFERIRKFYTCCGFANGENIAAGSSTAKDTYHQWFTSKGHHEIMFKPSSKYVAVGVARAPNTLYGYYWVMCTAR